MIAMPVESAGGGRLLSLGASVILVKKFVEFLWSINTAIFIRDCDSFYALADQVAGRLYGVLSRGFAIADLPSPGLPESACTMNAIFASCFPLTTAWTRSIIEELTRLWPP